MGEMMAKVAGAPESVLIVQQLLSGVSEVVSRCMMVAEQKWP
jgi:hypothetical protein